MSCHVPGACGRLIRHNTNCALHLTVRPNIISLRMKVPEKLKIYFLKTYTPSEILLILTALIGYILITLEYSIGSHIFSISLILLAISYLFISNLRGPKPKEGDPPQVGYRAFLIKLIYYTICIIYNILFRYL